MSDAHEGLKNAIAQVLGCPWQRCTVHFTRDMLGHVGRAQQPLVSGAIRQLFHAADGNEARERAGVLDLAELLVGEGGAVDDDGGGGKQPELDEVVELAAGKIVDAFGEVDVQGGDLTALNALAENPCVLLRGAGQALMSADHP